MQWGDEGKGKVVDYLTESADLVVRHQGVRLTYRELKERVDAYAAGFLALGIGKSSAATLTLIPERGVRAYAFTFG